MKRGKTGRSRVEEHLLAVGVVLVAVFWVVESILDTFVFGEGDLLGTLFPTSPEELWNRGLLAVVLLLFIGYTQRAVNGRRKVGELRSLVGSIVESSDDAIIGKTLEGVITSWNSGARRIYGYYEEEVVGEPITMLVPPERPDEIPGMLERIRRGESVEHYETERVTKDGRRLYVSLSVSPILDHDGQVVGASTIAHDVTERKEAEKALKRLSRQNALILNSAGQGIFGLDLQERTEFVNPAAARMLGYEVGELMGGYIHDIVHHSYPDGAPYPKEACPIYAALREGAVHRRTDEVFWRKDGTCFPVEYISTPIRENGEVVGAVAAFSDITKRKEAEEEIRRLNETLEERVAERTAQLVERGRRLKDLIRRLVAAQEEERRRVAYEVHDGLAQVAIATHQNLQAFADEHPTGSVVEPGELDRALELAKRTVKEARHVIEDLRPTALDDFGLATALRLQAEELENEGWEISYEETLGEGRSLSPEIETVLYRVAQEALTNVRKHARTRKAHVSLTCPPGKVRLEVRDEGRGFDPRVAPESSGPGERVGLSGMRERVALLGGELKISSKPGVGTSVVAEVPLIGEG